MWAKSITGHSISQWLPCPVPSWVSNTIGTWGGNSVKFSQLKTVLMPAVFFHLSSVHNILNALQYILLPLCNIYILFIHGYTNASYNITVVNELKTYLFVPVYIVCSTVLWRINYSDYVY